jgi:hypothetical protein
VRWYCIAHNVNLYRKRRVTTLLTVHIVGPWLFHVTRILNADVVDRALASLCYKQFDQLKTDSRVKGSSILSLQLQNITTLTHHWPISRGNVGNTQIAFLTIIVMSCDPVMSNVGRRRKRRPHIIDSKRHLRASVDHRLRADTDRSASLRINGLFGFWSAKKSEKDVSDEHTDSM